MLDLDALGLLEQAAADVGLSTEYAALIERARRADELEQAQRWIPVSERLPDPGEACLLSLENYWVGVATYNRARNQWRSDGGYIVQATNNATHWMPLPLPPNWPH